MFLLTRPRAVEHHEHRDRRHHQVPPVVLDPLLLQRCLLVRNRLFGATLEPRIPPPSLRRRQGCCHDLRGRGVNNAAELALVPGGGSIVLAGEERVSLLVDSVHCGAVEEAELGDG